MLLKKIIESSTFGVIPGKVVYTKVSKAPQIHNHFLFSKDKDEITVVTEESNLGELEIIERNKDYWTLIVLNVSAPFYSVGFLAAVSSAIAKANRDVLIVSTYSKDYILVQYDFLDGVKQVLLSLGFNNELVRIEQKKIRAGKGKMRGRKYKRRSCPLIVVSGPCNLLVSAKNLQGVDVCEVKFLNAELLAPGTMPGRLTLYSEGAIKLLEENKLFLTK